MTTTELSEPKQELTIELTLNDEKIKKTIPAGMLLSTFIRKEEYLTGTHRGCETGKCGACTVMVDGEPVKSCNMLATQVAGSELTTVEGLVGDDGELHPIQQSFWDTHGMQCGFCTPGMVMNSVALLEENDDPNIEEIKQHLAGNICRCTGYTKIVQSVQNAASEMHGDD